MADSSSSSAPDSPRRMLLWSPMSLPPRLYGTPRFASIWAETPRSLPLLPESMTWGHPSPALSRPDPDMEGGNFTYQNMEFGNEHLAALTATELARLRSDAAPTWTIEIPGWDRRVRRKDSWYDEDFFMPKSENEQQGPTLSHQTATADGDVETDENPAGPATLQGQTPEDMTDERRALRTESPDPGMTIHDVHIPLAPENQHVGPAYTWLPHVLPNTEHMTAHETKVETDQVGSSSVHTDLLTELDSHPTDELPDFILSSPSPSRNPATSNTAVLTMSSPSKSVSGDPAADRPTSSLRATAPIFSPTELGAWPNSPSSFSPTPILSASTIVVPPMSPVASHASTQRFFPNVPGPSNATAVTMLHSSNSGTQWEDTPATTKISWPTGQPGYTLDDQLQTIEGETARAVMVQSSSGYSVGDSEVEDIRSSTEVSIDPSPYSLTSYQSTRPMPTPEQGLEKAGYGGMMYRGLGISPSGNFNNDFARTPPTAPRAMLQQRNIVHPSASWTNSKTWVSEEARKRQEFARMQERARHMGTDRAPFMPQTFEQFLLLEVREQEAKIQEMRNKIKAKEETATEKRGKEHGQTLQPMHQTEAQAFGNDTRAGVPAILGPPNSLNPKDLRAQYETEWPSLPQLKVEGDLRIQRGFPNRRLPAPGFNPVNSIMAHRNQGLTASNEEDFIPDQLPPAAGIRWDRTRTAAHERTESQEIDFDEPQQPSQSLIRRIGDWVNEIDPEEQV